jgi:hypothetical protein
MLNETDDYICKKKEELRDLKRKYLSLQESYEVLKTSHENLKETHEKFTTHPWHKKSKVK